MKITSDVACRITLETRKEAVMLRRIILNSKPLEADEEGALFQEDLLNGMNQHLYPTGGAH